MARGGKRRTATVSRSAMLSDIARVSPATPFNIPFAVRRLALYPVEDLRRYSPLRSRPLLTISGRHVAPLRVTKSRKATLPVTVSFAAPGRTIVCVRRKRRREVLFAIKKRGRGSGARRRFNDRSDIKC